MAAPLKLISHKLCPYVQRAVIALTEKGIPFERIDIDLANKPEVVAVSGSNYVEVGFALGPPHGRSRRVVCFSALDNLVKGGAGNAVQCTNIRFGLPETQGLEFTGLHPS